MTKPSVADIIPITPEAAKKKAKKEFIGQGGMIQPFWGEFLTTPSPLEWSLNYCSHACAYCFANLNSPTRKGDASKALRQVAEAGLRSTLTDLYLRNKYPVCVANKTDPFSESNYRETLPVLLALKEAGIPIQFQTKGGLGIDEMLDGLPPSVWYITVAQLDDAVRKRIEPGAPSIGERLDLIDRLTEEGHYVVVGVNPCVPEWLPEPWPLMEALASRGVHGVWTDRLHLNEKQVAFLPPGGRKLLGDVAVDRALTKKMDDVEYTHMEMVREAVLGNEMEHFHYGYPAPTYYFDVWRQAYERTLPINQDVANAYYEADAPTGTLVSFEDYVEILEASATPFFKGRQRIGDYMRVVSYRTVEKVKQWSDWMTYRQLMWFAWENPGTKLSLSSHVNFAVATEIGDDGNEVVLTDDKGHPYHMFVRDGVSGYYLSMEEAEKLREEA